MSLPAKLVTFRIEMENDVFIEGLRTNSFRFLSRSGVINLVITWTRLYSSAQKINLPVDMSQRVLRIPLCSDVHVPGPRKSGSKILARRAS